MGNKWNNFFEALVDVCEAYSEAKEKANTKRMETEFFSDIFEEPALDKSDVVDAMIERGWSTINMRLVLGYINTPDQAKVAIKLIESGHSWVDVKNIVSDI